MKNVSIVILVAVFTIVGFFAGIRYEKSKQPTGVNFQNGGFRGRFRNRQFDENTRVIRGEVISKDKESITLKLPDGSSRIIFLSEKTKINKTVEGSIADLEVGKSIIVFGKENSDKSVSAEDIQLVRSLSNSR